MTFNLNEAVDKRIKKQALVEEVLSDLLGLKVLKEAVKSGNAPISAGAFPEPRPEDKEQLEIFLNNIQGNNLQTKVANINSFFSKFMSKDFNAEDPTLFEDKSNSQALQETISYIVFYKTLTALIAKLDASSAGFSFESFLSVLIGGNVLPATKGNAAKTLVDVVGSNEGDISAKLLDAKSPSVTGAYSNLIGDMKAGREVKYIVGLKNFGDKEKKEGSLSFAEFILTRENFVNILAKTSPSNLMGIRIRLSEKLSANLALEWEEVEAKFKRDLIGNLSMSDGLDNNKVRIRMANLIANLVFRENELQFFNLNTFKYDEERYNNFINNLEEILMDAFDTIRNNPELYNDPKYSSVLDFEIVDEDGNYTKNYNIIMSSVKNLKKLIDKKLSSAEKTETPNTFSVEDSIEMYNKANTEEERIQLLDRMLAVGSFSMSYGQLKSIESFRPYPETLDFGESKLQAVVSNLSNVTKVTGLRIIEDAQGMLEDLNKYFAGGLQEDTLADSARTKARRIDRKTKEISTKQT